MKASYISIPPKIDGHLKEACWSELKPESGFTQTIPEPDKPSRYQTEVWLAYDNQAIYVAARMKQPEAIQMRQISARDGLNRANADVFGVFLDTYNDKQNGFSFKVSSAGVQQDERLSGGEEYGDIAWDAVWDVQVQHTAEEWTVEMIIPFSAIRFSKSKMQTWRANFYRLVRKKNESSYWSPIDIQQSGFLAQAGLLEGLDNLKPPTRLFVFPYLSTGYLKQPEQNGTTTTRWLKSGGADVKYGISDAFTLDMTLIPDFSQVISDNLIRNLSPFEQQLTENRPFFTEGTELFNKLGMFYSRRIGARPSNYFSVQNQYDDTSKYQIQKNPNITTLYNAFKLSGRTKSKLGIGLFNAVASPMYATVLNKEEGAIQKVNTEPLTNYNVFVLDQSLKGQSFINFTNTSVLRQGNLNKSNASGLQYVQFFKKDMYSLSTLGMLSMRGSKFETKGTMLSLDFSKISGRFVYSLGFERLSPNFNQTDMGLQFDFNHARQYLILGYRNNKPKSKHLQMIRANLSTSVRQNVEPFVVKELQSEFTFFWLFKNFWDVTVGLETKPFVPIDFYQLRSFGKRMHQYPYLFGYLNGSSDSRKRLFFSFYAGYGSAPEPNTGYFTTSESIRYQFSRKLEATISGNATYDFSNIGLAYYSQVIQEPIVGRRNVIEYSGEESLKYNVNPFVNFTARMRHYNSTIDYLSFHTTDATGYWRNREIAFQDGFNENFNLQNVDVFFNWIFKPGSRLVISYKQWLNDYYVLNNQFNNGYFKNVTEIIKRPKAYELAVRVIFFIDYNQAKNINSYLKY